MRASPHVARTPRTRISILHLADSVLSGDHSRNRYPARSAGARGISSGLVYRSPPTSGASDPDRHFPVLRAYVLAAAVNGDPGIHQGLCRSPDGLGESLCIRRLAQIVGHDAIGESIVRRL